MDAAVDQGEPWNRVDGAIAWGGVERPIRRHSRYKTQAKLMFSAENVYPTLKPSIFNPKSWVLSMKMRVQLS